MTAVENKIPDISNLVNKTNYNTKISEMKNKYITTADYNKFTKDIVDNSIKIKNLVTKTGFDAKMTSFKRKIISNKSKHLLVENELKRLKRFDASCYRGKNYVASDDGSQNYLVFQPINKYLKKIGNAESTSSLNILIIHFLQN